MKRYYFLIALLVLSGYLIIFGSAYYQEQRAEYDSSVYANQSAKQYNNYVKDVHDENTSSERLQFITEMAASFPKDLQDKLLSHVQLRYIILDFQKAEKYLDEARTIQQTLRSNDGDRTHPMAMDLLNKAVPLYESCKKGIDRLSEVKSDNKYNFVLNYTKGEIYYRYMQLFSESPEAAKELFNQVVGFYKSALKYKPRDFNTVVNIELLIRDQQNMDGSPQPSSKQNRGNILNQQGAGLGSHRGN